MQRTRDQQAFYRDAAWQAHNSGREQLGDLLRIPPRWTIWIYWLLLTVCTAGAAFLCFFRVNEYAAGPAIIRTEDRSEIRSTGAGTIAEIAVRPGEQVAAGGLLLRLHDEQEATELRRLHREYELQLARSLQSPGDNAARQMLASLKGELGAASARLEARRVRAPRGGTVQDLRIRAGQLVSPGETLLSLVGQQGRASVLALLPGHSRPLLRPGNALRFELNGFNYAYQHLQVDSIAEEVIGPQEARKYLGPEVADAFVLNGPVIIVKAALPQTGFVSEGSRYAFHDGMHGKAEVRLRSERLIVSLLPSLKALGEPGNE